MTEEHDIRRLELATRIRTGRAALGWTQSEFAAHLGATARSIHRLEQGLVDPRHSTVMTIYEVFTRHGLVFEDREGGGFKLTVKPSVLGRVD
jgi:transcriptional regulator with XRE-family HTH domain